MRRNIAIVFCLGWLFVGIMIWWFVLRSKNCELIVLQLHEDFYEIVFPKRVHSLPIWIRKNFEEKPLLSYSAIKYRVATVIINVNDSSLRFKSLTKLLQELGTLGVYDISLRLSNEKVMAINYDFVGELKDVFLLSDKMQTAIHRANAIGWDVRRNTKSEERVLTSDDVVCLLTDQNTIISQWESAVTECNKLNIRYFTLLVLTEITSEYLEGLTWKGQLSPKLLQQVE